MIHYNTPYTIENGDTVTFTEGKRRSVTGKYKEGTLTGNLDGNLLKATFHNTKANAAGLMEITFHENGFDAKWKSGLEPGPMKGKWTGRLSISDQDSETKNNQQETSTINRSLLSKETAIAYCEQLKKENKSFQQKMIQASPQELVEVYSLEFDEEYFGNLKNHIDILRLRFDNSNESIEEHSGSDHLDIVYDLRNNCIYNQNDESDDEIYRFMLTYHASIPENYENESTFMGCYSVSNLSKEWTLYFHGNNLESKEGNISDETLAHIKSSINAKTAYLFLDSIISYL